MHEGKSSAFFQDGSARASAVKPILATDGDNWIVVRVWNSRFSVSDSDVGHVSLQTKNAYVSFWPAKKTSTFGKLHKGVKGYLNSLEDDLEKTETGEGEQIGEGRSPDLKIKLYSLNVASIEAEFEKFKSQQCKWSVWGSGGSCFKDKQIRNCSGIAAYLLKIGGLENLLPGVFPSITLEQEVTPPDGGRVGHAIAGMVGYVGVKVLGEKGFGVLITPDGVGETIQEAQKIERACYEYHPPLHVPAHNRNSSHVTSNSSSDNSKKCLVM